MKKLLISLTGSKKSGKSTAAQLLSEMFFDSKVIAIADKLKVECSVAYDIDLIHFHSQDLKEQSMIYPIRTKIETITHLIEAFKLKSTEKVKIDSNVLYELSTVEMRTPRDLMQNIGMFIRKVFGKQVHLKHLDLSNDVTIVSDVRFKNEFDYLDNLEGYIHIPIYIHNKEAESANDKHASEQDYKKFVNKCFKVDNNKKDLEDLFQQLESIVFEGKDVR